MKHLIIGTAGHVDHGKTSFIRALTGLETDRLKEEKKRGITIELGFAWLDLPSGGKAGIVDVPGHERFVGNMLAGAGGIDLALLIVAADEGVMQQTREHLEILKLLEVKHGMVIMTKSDMVDEEWLELAKDDVENLCKGTFLEGQPIFAVSSYTGDGIPEAREAIFKLLESLPGKKLDAAYRQPIDRVFVMEGFGTVVTGTALEGKVKVGDTLALYPSGEEVRVRSIQVHGEDVEEAFAGQRTAINLAQLSKSAVNRGDVLAGLGSMESTKTLDVRVSTVAGSPFVIKNHSRLHLHHGSRELLCRIRILEREELAPGETAVARLMLDEELACKYGDPFVLRFYSPIFTVGGGRILDPNPATVKIKDAEWRKHLEDLEKASRVEKLILAVDSASPHFQELESAMRRSGNSELSKEEQKATLAEAAESGAILSLNDQIWISKDYSAIMSNRAKRILEDFHAKEPLKLGLKREEMRTRLLANVKIELTDKLLSLMEEGNVISIKDGMVTLPGFKIELSPEQEKIRKELEKVYEKAGFTPPDNADVLVKYPKGARAEAVMSAMIDDGSLVRLDSVIHIHRHFYDQAKDYVVNYIKQNGPLKLADFRDHIQSSRKYAVAILDALDREKITIMRGEARELLNP